MIQNAGSKNTSRADDRCVVLLSSGLDSAVNLYMATHELQVALAITFDYGQRAAKNEIDRSRALCDKLSVPHKVIRLDFFSDFSKSALHDTSVDLPKNKLVHIDDLNISQQTARAVWVPNRNGVFLNVAAAVAEGLGAKFIVPGFNAEEAVTFPDNSDQFLRTIDQSFGYSTQKRVHPLCFTVHLNKTEIVALGRKLKVPFEALWPCYESGEAICGQCESCMRFQRAMGENF